MVSLKRMECSGVFCVAALQLRSMLLRRLLLCARVMRGQLCELPGVSRTLVCKLRLDRSQPLSKRRGLLFRCGCRCARVSVSGLQRGLAAPQRCLQLSEGFKGGSMLRRGDCGHSRVCC